MSESEAAGVDFGKLFASVDAMDAESFLGFIASDCVFRFGSSTPVTGHAAIRTAVEDFFSMFAAVEHELLRFIAEGNVVACEGIVTYTRHDGSLIRLPFANVFDVDGGQISVYRIYIDLGPLLAAQ